MTDEEIEKALEIHYRRGGLPDCETCPYFNEFCHGDCLRTLGKDMQDYINRLKAENAILKKNADEAFQQGLNEMKELVAPEIRKDTAKEILQDLYNHAKQGAHDKNNDFAFACDQIKTKILAEANKYGVEVKICGE